MNDTIPVSRAKTLSTRERDVMNLLARGFSYVEVAGLLGIKTSTTATFVKRVYRKLDVHSRAEAVFELYAQAAS